MIEKARGGQEQLQLLAALGLRDFETAQQCSERQQQMARRFNKAGELQGGRGERFGAPERTGCNHPR
jgi:hypothetical protein